MQQAPAFSAKKIAGQRSHTLARRARGRESTPDALPAPASVTAHRIDIIGFEADRITLRVDCSAGFYVRALARDLGERLGIGAHLAALRRTRTGDFTIGQAIELDTAERDADRATAAVVPLSAVLPGMASVVLTAEGVNRVAHGRDLGAHDTSVGASLALSAQAWVRLLDPDGQLVAIAQPQGAGLLHPSVVLM
jgi:tRNA pseudouridine55 synthase